MIKVQANQLQGKEFITLSQLPYLQSIGLLEWIPETSLFTIQLGEVEYDDCVLYEEYEHWFDNYYLEETLLLEF